MTEFAQGAAEGGFVAWAEAEVAFTGELAEGAEAAVAGEGLGDDGVVAGDQAGGTEVFQLPCPAWQHYR